MKVKKSQVVDIIKKVVEENPGKVNENIQAEYDFLMEEYMANPKNVTTEDLQSLITKLQRVGLIPLKEVKAESTSGEDTKADTNKKEEKGNDEEMVKGTKKTNTKATTTTTTKATAKTENKAKANTTTKATSKKATTKKAENSTKKVAPKVTTVRMTEVEEAYEFNGFPKTLKTELGTLKLATDIKTLKDLANVDEDREIVLVNAWTVDMLKEYNYDPMDIMEDEELEKLEADGFENDFDLLQVNFATEKVAYAVSLYTEVHTTYVPEGFEADENGLRNNGFINFQVYEVTK